MNLNEIKADYNRGNMNIEDIGLLIAEHERKDALVNQALHTLQLNTDGAEERAETILIQALEVRG
jgi:hypothetical protein